MRKVNLAIPQSSSRCICIHPPSQEATAARPSQPELLRRSRLKPWTAVGQSLWRRTRNAKRVPAEALAKEGCFGGFRRSPNRRHGCEAVGLHRRLPWLTLFEPCRISK